MLQVTPQMRILVAIEPAYFRRGCVRSCWPLLPPKCHQSATRLVRRRRGKAWGPPFCSEWEVKNQSLMAVMWRHTDRYELNVDVK